MKANQRTYEFHCNDKIIISNNDPPKKETKRKKKKPKIIKN